MIINMTSVQFDKLTELCRSSKYELSGIMDTQVNNGEIFVVGVKLVENKVIEKSNSHMIVYNRKEYLTKTIYELAFNNSPIYIIFHTHPSFDGELGLSEADINNLKYVQELAKKVVKINSNNCTKVISGIVTGSEIAFYTYDKNSDKVTRLPFYVNGVEKIPSFEKSKFQVFKDSFLEGRRKSRK